MLVQSHFCHIPGHPYSGVTFADREVKIVGRGGEVVYQATVTAPTGWSETAVKMLAQKYCRKAGVPDETVPVDEAGVPAFLRRSVPKRGTTFGGETDFRKVFDRLAGCWGYWGWESGYFDSEDDAARFVDEVKAMLVRQVFAPNTPQWLSTGLYWAYGIQGDPEGRWAINATGEAVQETLDTYSQPSVGACYILNIEDTLLGPDGIMDFMVRESRIFKAGSGSGANYSRVRGKGEPLSHGGHSSGLLSFLKPIDSNAGAIKSGGTSRRSARMVIVEDDHPDVEAFVDWKALEEKKVAALVAGGKLLKHHLPKVHAAALAGDDRELALARAAAVAADIPRQLLDQAEAAGRESLPAPVVPGVDDPAFEADAYTTVSGQNANNSVSLSAAFMNAVEADGPWNLHWRTEKVKAAAEGRAPKPCKTIKARHLWDRIARAAWECADPGVYFSTTVNDWHTCPEDGRLEAPNPCSEFHFLNNSTCNLACLNLVALQGDTHKQTAANVRRAARIVTLLLDITVTMSSYPSRAVAEGAMKYRTVGLGFANLGGLLMRNGIPYDSDAGRGWAACLTGLIHFTAVSTSAELAGVTGLGAFPRYAANAAHVKRVLENHAAFLNGGGYTGLSVEPPDPTPWLTAAPLDLLEAACDAARTALHDYKSNGGLRNAQLTLVMPAGTVGLTMDCDTTGCEPDFSLVKHKELAGGGFMTITNQSVGPALETLGYAEGEVKAIMAHVLETGTATGAPGLKPEHLSVFDTANGDRAISIDGHLKMMAAIQPLVSGSLSKTLNLPSDCTVADVRATYARAYLLSLKCAALYRDQSKLSQPLQAAVKEEKERKANAAAAVTPTTTPRRQPLPNRRKGYTQKFRVPGHKVYLNTGEYPDGALGEIFITTNKEGATLKSFVNAFAQAVSIGLQYGVPLDEFVDAFIFTRFEPNGPVTGHDRLRSCTSLLDAIFRDLAISYLGRDDLGHTLTLPTPGANGHARHTDAHPPYDGVVVTAVRAKAEVQYIGTPCPNCGLFACVMDGKCAKCTRCGASGGCTG